MRRLGSALLLIALIVPAPARALFHSSDISEVMSGSGGDPNVQYVEIRMLSGAQNQVAHTRLTAFSCDGTSHTVLIDNMSKSVPNQGGNVRWIMGTEAFASAACLQPDFFFPPGIPTCGMVCWGAPVVAFLPPANPATWDAAKLDNYIDCVAYGGYTGPTKSGSGSPTPFGPGDGEQSLTKTSSSGSNSADFFPQEPTPQNNASLMGNFASPCASTTTTTSTTAPRALTTTTTLPGSGVDSRLSGKRLVLKDNANKSRRSLLVLSSDAGLGLGAGNGSPDDPTTNGGSVRIRTALGCGVDGTLACDATFPTGTWQKVGKGANKGYRAGGAHGSTSPIKLVLLKPGPGRGRILRITGKGADLPSLARDPGAIDVVVATGAKHYCLRFSTVKRFKLGRMLIASGTAPAECP